MAEKDYVIADLPVNKDFHFFVSYQNSDTDRVHILVKGLESKGVKCCYSERDFVPGSTIIENITAKMNSSLHMLVILSEEFAKSKFAKREIIEALHKIDEGYSIIPIMVEPCTVPANLQNIRYIDAKDSDATEMPSLIIDALVKNKIKEDFKRTTGSLMSIGLTPYADFPRRLSLSRYKLEFHATARQNMRDHQIELTRDELLELADTVTGSYLVKHWHIFSNFVWAASLLLFIALIVFICIYLVLSITIVGLTAESSKGTLIGLHVFISVVILALFVFFLFCLYTDNNKSITSKFSKRFAQHKLWLQLVHALSHFNEDARDKGRIIMFDYINGVLKLMRYDFRICQAQFMHRCEQRDSLKALMRNGESLKDYTDRLFDNFVKSERCLELTEPSFTKRHTLSNGAKCLCLLIEQGICQYVRKQ